MNIGLVSRGYNITGSGSEKVAENISVGLFQKGHKIHIFTKYRNEYKNLKNDVKTNPVIHPILNNIFRSNYLIIFQIPIILLFSFQIIKKYRIQIINVHESEIYAILYGLICKIKQIPMIITWRDSDVDFNRMTDSNSLKSKIGLKLSKLESAFSLRLATKIISGSICPKRISEVYNIPIERIYLSPHPIIEKEIDNTRIEQIKQKWNLSNKIVITSLSTRLDRLKGIDIILDIAYRIKEKGITDIIFLIIGGLEPQYSNNLRFWKLRVKKMKIQKYVIFPGHQVDIENFLSLSNIYLFSTYGEPCCSIGMLEAMVYSLSVITRKTENMSIWFENMINILFTDSLEYEDILDKILFLRKNSKIRKQIGYNARLNIQRKWNLDVCVGLYEKVFRKM